MAINDLEYQGMTFVNTPTELTPEARVGIATTLNVLLADMFALYVKTKNFQWHMSGPRFRDYHLLLDEQAEQIFATTDVMAERVRRLGGMALGSIGQIANLQRVRGNNADHPIPAALLAELQRDNKDLTRRFRKLHAACDEYGDVATSILVQIWIDESERRTHLLSEAIRND